MVRCAANRAAAGLPAAHSGSHHSLLAVTPSPLRSLSWQTSHQQRRALVGWFSESTPQPDARGSNPTLHPPFYHITIRHILLQALRSRSRASNAPSIVNLADPSRKTISLPPLGGLIRKEQLSISFPRIQRYSSANSRGRRTQRAPAPRILIYRNAVRQGRIQSIRVERFFWVACAPPPYFSCEMWADV